MDEAAMDDDVDAATSRGDEEPSALLSRLRVIEDQPLDTRAEALAHTIPDSPYSRYSPYSQAQALASVVTVVAQAGDLDRAGRGREDHNAQ